MKANSHNHGKLTVKAAIRLAKECFREEHHRRVPNNASISVHPRWGGGRYILISGGNAKESYSTEFYFE